MKMDKDVRAQFVEKIRNVLTLTDVFVMDKVVFTDGRADCPFCRMKGQFELHANGTVYSCFACREGGDLFAYIMAKDGVDFEGACEALMRVVTNRFSKMTYLTKAFNKSDGCFEQGCAEILEDTSCRGGADPRLLKMVCKLTTVKRIMKLASKIDPAASQAECLQKVEEICDIADRATLNARGFTSVEWKNLADASFVIQKNHNQ